MADVKKTIQINPEIFNIGSRKNKTEKRKKHHGIAPLISPNIIKNKLLNRIKEHKIAETSNTSANSNRTTNSNANNTKYPKPNLVDKYSNEFNESLEYLQSLSKQKKKDEENERRKNYLLNKTVRNIIPNSNTNIIPHVQLELPIELANILPLTIETPIIINKNNNSSNYSSNNSSSYKVDNELPYGCLKGGVKPTYRDLNKTRKVYEVTSPSATFNVQNINLEREQRLNLLKAKIKEKERDRERELEREREKERIMEKNREPFLNSTSTTSTSTTSVNNPSIMDVKINSSDNDFSKQLIKKTIKRKYTLGKSKINNSVAILIKDNKTRKNIINAQKELKHHSINEVKKYLREHNMIKAGSNAPNDVIRKLYESCMLAGEITNLNKDTLLHNFVKEQDCV